MAWRVIGISNPANLGLKDHQLVIKQEETVSLPIEDIDTILIDSYGVNITANLITELSNSGTTVIICDSRHLPSSILLPYSQHSRQAKITKDQLAMGQALRKQLWRAIVSQKITNQADVLKHNNLNDTPIRKIAAAVRSGDKGNRESIAARVYFVELLDDQTRRKPTWYNAALNYGYAIVRGHIARHLAARGLVVSQGIFHRSELNNYNLADDIIEPYRAIVDDYIVRDVSPLHLGGEDAQLSIEDKKLILDIMNVSVIIDSRKLSVKNAIERTAESLVQAIEADSTEPLALPSIILE